MPDRMGISRSRFIFVSIIIMYNSFIDKKSLYVQHIQTVFVLLLSVKRGVCTYVSPWITQQELPLRLRCQQLQRLQNPLEQPQRQEPLLLLRALQSQRQTQCFLCGVITT